MKPTETFRCAPWQRTALRALLPEAKRIDAQARANFEAAVSACSDPDSDMDPFTANTIGWSQRGLERFIEWLENESVAGVDVDATLPRKEVGEAP